MASYSTSLGLTTHEASQYLDLDFPFNKLCKKEAHMTQLLNSYEKKRWLEASVIITILGVGLISWGIYTFSSYGFDNQSFITASVMVVGFLCPLLFVLSILKDINRYKLRHNPDLVTLQNEKIREGEKFLYLIETIKLYLNEENTAQRKEHVRKLMLNATLQVTSEPQITHCHDLEILKYFATTECLYKLCRFKEFDLLSLLLEKCDIGEASIERIKNGPYFYQIVSLIFTRLAVSHHSDKLKASLKRFFLSAASPLYKAISHEPPDSIYLFGLSISGRAFEKVISLHSRCFAQFVNSVPVITEASSAKELFIYLCVHEHYGRKRLDEYFAQKVSEITHLEPFKTFIQAMVERGMRASYLIENDLLSLTATKIMATHLARLISKNPSAFTASWLLELQRLG